MKVQFPTCVIEFTRRTTLDTNIENGIFFIIHDGSQSKWKPSSLAKVESDINFVFAAQAQVSPWFSKSFLYELFSCEEPDTVLWHEESESNNWSNFWITWVLSGADCVNVL